MNNEFLTVKAKAEKGDATAQFNLGLMYMNDLGVEKDYAEAVKWYNKAAFSNLMSQWKGPQRPELSETEPDAAKNAADLKKLMSPQQVGEAQKRTKELKALIEAKNKSQ